MSIYLDGDWCIYLFYAYKHAYKRAHLWCGDVLVAEWSKRKGLRINDADLWELWQP